MAPSEQIHIRLDPELHTHLKAEAAKLSMSLNTYVLTRLAGASGFKRGS